MNTNAMKPNKKVHVNLKVRRTVASSKSSSSLTKQDNQQSSSSQVYGNLKNQANNRTVAAPEGHVCFGCNRPIKRDKYLLKACDKYWHENCLRCDRCHSRLGELGSTLYRKSNMNLCRKDYLEMFGKTGICSVCNKLITASESIMRAKENIYHLDCFACQICNQRFCVGDRFYLCENKVVCQYDFEEHILPIQSSFYHQQEQHHHDHQEIACYPMHETSPTSTQAPTYLTYDIKNEANNQDHDDLRTESTSLAQISTDNLENGRFITQKDFNDEACETLLQSKTSAAKMMELKEADGSWSEGEAESNRVAPDQSPKDEHPDSG